MLAGKVHFNSLIKWAGFVQTLQIFCVLLSDNLLHFYKVDGEWLVMFQLKTFLKNVDAKLFDVNQLSVLLKHFFDKTFLIVIENYFLLFSLAYDRRSQKYYLRFVKTSKVSNELYCLRLSKGSDPQKYQIALT